MFLLLTLILTVVAISLKLTASGLDLANKVQSRYSKNNKISEVARKGLATSVLFIRLIAFIISRLRDIVCILGTVVYGLFIGIIIVAIISSASYISLFMNGDVDGSLIYSQFAMNTIGSPNNKDDAITTSSFLGKPEGVSEDSWSKADSIGKSMVVFASNSILNPPNGEYLLYEQGDTGVGIADCSVFVCAVMEGVLHKTFGGLDAPDGYDFAKNKKSDLAGYVTTYGMQAIVRQKPESKIGNTRTGMHYALPGDILLNDGHVGIYVGKNEQGVDVMVHASTDIGATCSGDINLTDGKNLQVGFSRVWGTYDIIRPSKLLGI